MKFYYVAHEFNPEQPVKTDMGKRLAFYTKKHYAIKQCDKLNRRWQEKNENWGKEGKILPNFIYKVYYVESEPKEIE